jgi:hypothetical protein
LFFPLYVHSVNLFLLLLHSDDGAWRMHAPYLNVKILNALLCCSLGGGS